MNKTFRILECMQCVLICSAAIALGLSATSALANDVQAEKFFAGSKNPAVDAREQRALDIAKRWSAAGGSAHSVALPQSSAAAPAPAQAPPAQAPAAATAAALSAPLPTTAISNVAHPLADIVPGAGGSVQFVFGTAQPSVICAVLQVCDIALQAGEVVNSVNVGDSARWLLEPAVTGVAPNEQIHIIVKPLDVGLETSLAVHTNRRVYHMRLKSHRHEYMPKVSFLYTEEAAKKWEAVLKREQQEVATKQTHTIKATGEYLGDLDFAYDVQGQAPWKPVRVYNDGQKTIIEMPPGMSSGEAPTLLVVRRDATLFTDAENVVVNYRLINNRFIVDSLFDKAVLLAGVGSRQEKIIVTRKKS